MTMAVFAVGVRRKHAVDATNARKRREDRDATDSDIESEMMTHEHFSLVEGSWIVDS